MTNEEKMKSYFEEFYDYVDWHFNIRHKSWGYFHIRWYWCEEYDCSDAFKIEPVIYWGA